MRRLTKVLVFVVAVLAIAACDDISTLESPDAPVILTGAQLPALTGEPPANIVAFAHSRPGGVPTWTQIPVQIDERKLVDFGSPPKNNNHTGVTGTVYGTAPIGVTSLQYADASTWVGADNDPTFDVNDELVFMAADAGGKPRAAEATEPVGVQPGSGVEVRVNDPAEEATRGWVYLFVSDGSLDPAAGQNYVDYQFSLSSGTYLSSYKRASGPNPETSRAITDSYEIGFGDRWIEKSWQIHAGTASGVDILDGNKNQFALTTCMRSNATFAAGSGAFVANIDGPVRGIRSYIGANSGPLTQRTHRVYRDREEIQTDLRVHEIAAIMDYIDLSPAAVGMTYRSSEVPTGVAVDGVLDNVPMTSPTWESWAGPQGSVITTADLVTNIPFSGGIDGATIWFQRDEANTPLQQCWGDAHLYGAAGPWITQTILNTDPRANPSYDFTTLRTVLFAEPGVDAEFSATWAERTRKPFTVSVMGYEPA